MKKSLIFGVGILLSPLMASGDVTFRRLQSPPVAITEQFYETNNLRLSEINSTIIKGIHFEYQQGKSHARIFVAYNNTTTEALSPRYIIKLYNSYGIYMGGISVPEDSDKPEEEIASGAEGAKTLRLRVVRLADVFMHTNVDDFPDDFSKVRWISILDNKAN